MFAEYKSVPLILSSRMVNIGTMNVFNYRNARKRLKDNGKLYRSEIFAMADS